MNVGLSVSAWARPRRQGDEEGCRLDEARTRAVPRNGGLRAVRFGPRRRDAALLNRGARLTELAEAAAVLAAADGRADCVDLCRHQWLDGKGKTKHNGVS
jgi:hypothetical protein